VLRIRKLKRRLSDAGYMAPDPPRELHPGQRGQVTHMAPACSRVGRAIETSPLGKDLLA
jgi:hypothetical protein